MVTAARQLRSSAGSDFDDLRRAADLSAGGREDLRLAFESVWRAFDDEALWPPDLLGESLLRTLFRYGPLAETARRMTAAEAEGAADDIRRFAESVERLGRPSG